MSRDIPDIFAIKAPEWLQKLEPKGDDADKAMRIADVIVFEFVGQGDAFTVEPMSSRYGDWVGRVESFVRTVVGTEVAVRWTWAFDAARVKVEAEAEEKARGERAARAQAIRELFARIPGLVISSDPPLVPGVDLLEAARMTGHANYWARVDVRIALADCGYETREHIVETSPLTQRQVFTWQAPETP